MVFVGTSIHVCLYNGCHLVAYEVDFRFFQTFSLHFVHCLLNVLECKHQLQSMAVRRKTMSKKKMAWKTHLSI